MKYNRNDENYVYYFIGKNIAKYRKAKGWTQEELANKAMYSKQFISNIENNIHQTFALGTLWKLAQVLEIDMYKLCIEEDIKAFKLKHISMSGYGIHILCLIKNSALVANRKVNIKSNLNINRIVDGKQKFPEIEFYTSGKLFALPSEINALEDNITDMTNEY